MQKLAAFTRLHTLVLHLQSEFNSDIYEGLKYLTTLTQLRNLTFRANLLSLDAIEEFFKCMISLRSLDLQLTQRDGGCKLAVLTNLTSLETLSISAPYLTALQFLSHLQKLKYFLVVSPCLDRKEFTDVLALTELTNLAIVTREQPNMFFYEQISKLKSLQVLVMETWDWNGDHADKNPLDYICSSLPKLNTLIWNNTQTVRQIPKEITKLENLRVLRIRSKAISYEILAQLPYLEIQSDDADTYEYLKVLAQRLQEEMKAKSPDMTDDEISKGIAKIRLVEKWTH
jgi:hypothetical protein